MKRKIILVGFRELGFNSVQAFYNVCKSVDVTLSSFELIEFYKGTRVQEYLFVKLNNVLETIKYE